MQRQGGFAGLAEMNTIPNEDARERTGRVLSRSGSGGGRGGVDESGTGRDAKSTETAFAALYLSTNA